MRYIDITSETDFARHAPAWNELARQAGALFFQSPSWVRAWADSLEACDRLGILVVGPVDEPSGVLAIARARVRLHPRIPFSVRCLMIAGSGRGAADHLGPVVREDQLAVRLMNELPAIVGSDPIVMTHLSERHSAAFRSAFPSARRVGRRPGPVVRLDGEGSLDSIWNTKLRKNLRRRERLMCDAGLARRWTRLSGPEGHDLLEQLRRVHIARWVARGGTGLFDEGRMRFLKRLVQLDHGEDGVWIELIESDDVPVAALLGFQYGSTFCAYKSGWDPSLRELGLGILLHSDAIRRAASIGLTRYDFLRGTEGHKYTLGGANEFDETWVVPIGLRGQPLLAKHEFVRWRDTRMQVQDT